MTTVLHVVESFASGVASAIDDYVANSPDVEHHILYSTRSDAPVSGDRVRAFASATRMRPGHISRIRQVAETTKKLNVTIVHAHSTWAGVYSRLALGSEREVFIIYTPHCYAFERLDLYPTIRGLIRAGESLLSRRTDVVAGCSPREVLLAESFWRSPATCYLPNVLPVVAKTIGPSRGPTIRVAGAGRMGPQKDPNLFAEIAKLVSKQTDGFEFVWLGGGAPGRVEMLEEAGVRVTGWISRPDVMRELHECDIYAHTARWEGFPIGILEAVAAGVASVVRETVSTRDFPDISRFCSAQDAADRIMELRDPIARIELVQTWGEHTALNTSVVQAEVLGRLYGMGISTSSRVRPRATGQLACFLRKTARVTTGYSTGARRRASA